MSLVRIDENDGGKEQTTDGRRNGRLGRKERQMGRNFEGKENTRCSPGPLTTPNFFRPVVYMCRGGSTLLFFSSGYLLPSWIMSWWIFLWTFYALLILSCPCLFKCPLLDVNYLARVSPGRTAFRILILYMSYFMISVIFNGLLEA